MVPFGGESLLRTELVDCGLFECLAGAEDCRWEIRLVGSVRVILRFEAKAVVGAVSEPARL